MIVCPNCAKENQDHYKFCLGCGAKLPPPGQAPTPPAPPPPAASIPAPSVPAPAPRAAPPPPPAPAPAPPPPVNPYGGAPQAPQAPPPQAPPGPYGQPQHGTYGQPAPSSQPPYTPPAQPAQPPPPAAAPSGQQNCSKCGTPNPPQFKFCGACGNSLQAAPPSPPPPSPPPPAPPPSTEGTAVGPAPGAPQQPQPAQPAPQPGPEPGVPAKTMFMDANQRPAMASGPATIRLVLMREDGSEGGVLVIEGGPEPIGRSHGPPFDSDAYLDPDHARLTAVREGLLIDSANSLNGVYIKLDGRVELQHADFFRVGQELLFYEDLPEPTPTADGTERMGSPNPGYWGRVSVMVSPTRSIAAYPIQDDGIGIGREDGDITFPDDGYVSGSHCRIIGDDDGVWLEDLGSSNGTYMRVRPNQLIRPSTLILIGQQLFRVELG